MNFHRIILVLVFLAGIPVYSYGQVVTGQADINRINDERRIQRENDDRLRRSSQINGMQDAKGNGVTFYKKRPSIKKSANGATGLSRPMPLTLTFCKIF